MDCAVSDWEKRGACSNSCGKGFQHSIAQSTRLLLGGKTCPGLTDVRNCEHPIKCPVDCELSIWSAFSQCSVTCGTGERVRRRIVVTAPAMALPVAICRKRRPAMRALVPRIAKLAPLETGQHARVHVAVARSKGAARGDGSCKRRHAVPKLHEERTCHVRPCPVDCAVGAWASTSRAQRHVAAQRTMAPPADVIHRWRQALPTADQDDTLRHRCLPRPLPSICVGHVDHV